MQRLRSILFATGLLTLSVTPLAAQYKGPYTGPTVAKNRVGFQIGLFSPDGDSAYWRDKELEFTGRSGDFEDFAFSFDYQRFLSERFALLATSTFYEGSADQSYLDWVDEAGGPVRHTTTLGIATFEIGIVFRFLSRDAPVIPYVAAAGGLYAWELEESGDFIDFSLLDPEIFTDTFSADGQTFGWSGILGLEIPLNRNWSVTIEARFRDADAELGDDFQGFGTLDLSGQTYLAGMSWGF